MRNYFFYRMWRFSFVTFSLILFRSHTTKKKKREIFLFYIFSFRWIVIKNRFSENNIEIRSFFFCLLKMLFFRKLYTSDKKRKIKISKGWGVYSLLCFYFGVLFPSLKSRELGTIRLVGSICFPFSLSFNLILHLFQTINRSFI